jgi:hypothetical protein
MLRRRLLRGARVWDQAEQVWVVLTAVAMAKQTGKKKTVTYGELAEWMGYNPAEGYTLVPALTLVGQMCLATKLPPLNVLVVTKHGQQPGDELVLGPGFTVAKAQKAVLSVNWFEWRAPVAGSFRALIEKNKADPPNVDHQVNMALAKLARRGDVDTLLELNKVRRNPALAVDPDYQRRFKGYYRLRQKSARFYERFFTILQAGASAEVPPSLSDILQKLYDDTKERHLSFGSKMRATLADDAVIFDKNVASYFRIPSSSLPPGNDWLVKSLRRHEKVAQGVQAFVRSADWQQKQILFDQAFPNAAHLPDIRKADLIIWAAEDS